jgi:uncharacterized membrane protein
VTSPELKNIQAIMNLERETRSKRSLLERIIDGVGELAARPVFTVVHVLWFGIWLAFNTLGLFAFDRYPFNLLSLLVSLEALVLTGFVLMAQARMTRQAEKRAHLDLQINLLAEQELTAILKVQCALAEHAGIDLSSVDPRLHHLRQKTDVHGLAAALDVELASVTTFSTEGEDAKVSARGPHADRKR